MRLMSRRMKRNKSGCSVAAAFLQKNRAAHTCAYITFYYKRYSCICLKGSGSICCLRICGYVCVINSDPAAFVGGRTLSLPAAGV